MPACLFEAYVQEMDSVMAEKTLELADAAAYPHLKDPSTWLRRTVRRATSRRYPKSRRRRKSPQLKALFTWSLVDGGEVVSDMQPVDMPELKQNLGHALQEVKGLEVLASVEDN